jgi:hypothetical protein
MIDGLTLVNELKASYYFEHAQPYSAEAYRSPGASFEEFQAYVCAMCQYVREEARRQGVVIHFYQLVRAREVSGEGRYNVLVNGEEVLRDASRVECRKHVLERIRPEDLYWGGGRQLPETGQELKKAATGQALPEQLM